MISIAVVCTLVIASYPEVTSISDEKPPAVKLHQSNCPRQCHWLTGALQQDPHDTYNF